VLSSIHEFGKLLIRNLKVAQQFFEAGIVRKFNRKNKLGVTKEPLAHSRIAGKKINRGSYERVLHAMPVQ
jgi:hypothetical protein